MSERAPRRRGYDASGRQEKARTTRRAVVAAAQELIEERGYAATTVAAVASRAGVSADSIYKGFGTKAALIKAVFDVVIAGDDEAVPVSERPEVQRIIEAPSAAEKLLLYAEGAALRAERSALVQIAVRDSASSDEPIGELWRTIQEQRLNGATMFAQHLFGTGGLREGIGVDEIRDVVWACISVEVYDLLVLQRGWSREDYATWLARTLTASICADPGPPPRRDSDSDPT
ncbi:TetR/AcrR family transcriptional regulator [Nocardioides oleivorans]|uniref:TetR/AcrR family transcriptional regulator n=1 Tax=Nocardioides oleivorans TaxID=273676 RepID=A0A4Q2RU03_9ACTN|nr:TetR/AcrR family transcriptional regulator [Nocardioides oleivorans]